MSTAARAHSLAGKLADFFAMLKDLGTTDRAMANEFLRSFLLGHPEILGVWSVWEPDAFDGRDHAFREAPGHDESGRFIPFWHRLNGVPELEPNSNYEKPESGEWYWMPSLRNEEMIFDAYEHPVNGRPLLITTQATPIVLRNRCVGVVGIDVLLDDLCATEPTAAVTRLEATLARGHLLISREGEVRAASALARSLLKPAAVGRKACWRALPKPLEAGFTRWSEVGGSIEQSVRVGARELRLRFCPHPETSACVVVVSAPAGPLGKFAAANLSPREEEVLEWLSRGKANDEIALILGISGHTVKHHVEHIFAKLGVENRYAAAALHREKGSPT